MTTKELTEKLCERLQVSEEDVSNNLKVLNEILEEKLSELFTVELPHIGEIRIKKIPERLLTEESGDRALVPPNMIPRLHPSKEFFDSLIIK